MWEYIIIFFVILAVIVIAYLMIPKNAIFIVPLFLPPSDVEFKINGSQALIKWSPIEGISDYEVYITEDPGTIETRYTVKDATFYYFTVNPCKTYSVRVSPISKSPPVSGQSMGPRIDGVVRRLNTLSVLLPTKGGPYRVTAGSSPDNLNLTGKITSPGRPSDFTVDVSSIPPKDPIYIEAVEIGRKCTTSPTKYTYQP